MMPSRFLVAGLALALTGAAQPAMAQPQCVQPAEKTAFDVRALQSQLMVIALTCGEHDRYNAFVKRYERELTSSFRTLTASYRRAGGTKALDGYITTLANAQSQDGIRQGTRFCANARPMFDAALAAPTDSSALSAVAQANNLSNPHGFGDCATTPAAATTRSNRPATTRPASTNRSAAAPQRTVQASTARQTVTR